MTTTKYKIRVINETIVDDVSLNEAKQIADILETRNGIDKFVGKVCITYSEVEKIDV